MNWTDHALILDIAAHGEGHARVRVLSREHGLYAGFVRHIRSKHNLAVLHRGNLVKATWNARLEDHMGTLKCDLITPYGTRNVLMRDQLSAMNVVCAMILSCLHERQSFGSIFESALILMDHLEDLGHFTTLYQKWELGLLRTLGFELDLSRCADTGTTEDLTYVSPKTGRAVCELSAKPYKSRLLRLPNHLLVENSSPTWDQVLEGFQVSGFFIQKWILDPKNTDLPPARARFLDRLAKIDKMGQF